jgi:biotin transport system substrate-specific component
MQSTLPLHHLDSARDLRHLPRTLTGRALLAIAATGLVALCAHISIPLYFTPVPITLQTLAVIFIGLALGPTLGASTMLLYLAEGAAGLPVFSPHGPGGIAQLLGPTAGYLFSYPLAAAAAGAVARAARALRPVRAEFDAAALGALAASLIIFASGATWLAHLFHLTPAAAWHMAVAPFLAGEIIKIIVAAGCYASLRRWHRS